VVKNKYELSNKKISCVFAVMCEFIGSSLQHHVHSRTMYGSYRLRSRTPPHARSRVQCCICFEDVEPEDRWVCFVCPVYIHKACEDTRRNGSTLRGCLQCGRTKSDVVAEQKLFPATRGIMCYICSEVINEGELCDMCAGGRGFCQAHWHPKCMWPQFHQDRPEEYEPKMHRCPACGLSKWRALDKRRQ
jgi:hypothetical protein